MRRRTRDERLLTRTAIRLGLLTAALVAAVVVAVSVSVAYLVVREQEASDRALLQQAVRTADDADDPPAGMWLAIVDNGEYEATTGLPPQLPDATSMRAAVDQGRTTSVRRRIGGRDLQILTAPRAHGAVEAVLDLRTTDRLRTHVVETTLGVGLVGLLAAAAVAVLVARRAVRPMAHALALQRAFVADASHELRTPLTLLTTRAQLLRDAVADGDDGALQDAEGVVRDAGKLSDVVDDLLVAADLRADSDRIEVDVLALCREVVESAAPYADGRGITLSVTGESAVALVTAPAVRRAVVALVDNALQHAPRHGWVEVHAGPTAAGAEIAVTDSGPGLDPSSAERLFERFASGGSGASRRSYGLGLALARDVATRHDGTIAIAPPSVGRGARFVLSLPRRGSS